MPRTSPLELERRGFGANPRYYLPDMLTSQGPLMTELVLTVAYHLSASRDVRARLWDD